MVSGVDAFNGIVEAPNPFVNVGALITFIEALAVLPVPPSAELTLPERLGFVPSVVDLTSTLSVHERPEPITPPLRLTTLVAATATGVPLHPFTKPFSGELMTIPGGSVSLNATALNAWLGFGLVIVNVSVVTPVLVAMLAAPNALLIAGGWMTGVETLGVTVAKLLPEMDA